MPSPIPPNRRAAFLKALTETGNYTLAAERAGIHRSWAKRWRKRDAGFRAETDALCAEASRRFRDAGVHDAAAGQGYQQSEELLMRGCTKRLTQLQRTRPGQWSPRIEARFLGLIGQSCNVLAACRALGIRPSAAYRRRKLWPGFAKAWDEAIALGTIQLEYALVEQGCNFVEGVEPDHDSPMADMATDQAIRLLSLYKRSNSDERRGRHPLYRRKTLDEVRPSIQRKIDAIVRARALGNGPQPSLTQGSDTTGNDR